MTDESTNDAPSVNESPRERNIYVRILAAIAWLVIFYVGTNMLIGGIVGGIAGVHNPDNSYAAGAEASAAVFAKYGLYILVAQIFVFVSLIFLGKLPGTTKRK